MFVRIVSGLLAAAIGAWAIIAGGLPLLAVAMVVAVLSSRELCDIARNRDIPANTFIAVPGTALAVVASYSGHFDYLPAIFAGIVISSLVAHIVFYGTRAAISGPAVTVMASSYIGWPIALLFQLRGEPRDIGGAWFTLLAVAVVVATDSGAYFSGFALGRTKLCPAISPKKTVEGALGGLFFGILTGVLFNLVAPRYGLLRLPWSHTLVLSLLTSVSGEAGDLVESAIKRDAGVKDSGVFLPGHGGALDRFDSVVFGIAVVYYYVVIFGRA
ncbi:MAG TPA: phosphatidate cytidylyltransferase [Firmicutes bacterium]|nr:phosphatidate cytidylyltransferase [Bacillota bacterium]